MTEPEDLARAVLFFASDLARDITGQFLLVDGGANLVRNRPVLGRERFTLGKTPAAAASRGVPRSCHKRSAAPTRGDGCQRSDESRQQSESSGSGRACGAACSSCACCAGGDFDAARSGIRMRLRL